VFSFALLSMVGVDRTREGNFTIESGLFYQGVGELRYDEAQTRSPTTKMIFLILSRNRNISKSKNSELIIELNALTFVQMQE